MTWPTFPLPKPERIQRSNEDETILPGLITEIRYNRAWRWSTFKTHKRRYPS